MDDAVKGIELRTWCWCASNKLQNMVTHEGNEKELVSGSVNCVIWDSMPLSYLTQPLLKSVQPTLQTQYPLKRKHLRQTLKPSIFGNSMAWPVLFWHTHGGIGRNRKRTTFENWGLWSMVLCVSLYSGRCTLSNHMSDRDANRRLLSHAVGKILRCCPARAKRRSTVKFLKVTQCQPLTCVWLKISQTFIG